MLLLHWASLFGCSACWWWILLKGIRQGDPESGLSVGRRDRIYMAVTLGINSVVSGLAYPEEQMAGLFFSTFLTILAVNGWVDCRTHLVYRFYSVLLIVISLLYLLYCQVSEAIPGERKAELAVTIGMDLGLLLLQLRFHVAGMGDVMNLFPCAVFLCLSMIQRSFLLLEVILIHYILACLLMVLTNLPSFQWKGIRSRMTERIPFVADIYGAAVAMLLIRIWEIPI